VGPDDLTSTKRANLGCGTTTGDHAMATVRVARFADLDTATLYALLRLRVDVFVVEQRCPYPELDGRDTEPDTRHVWIEGDGRPIAYLRMLADPGGAVRIGRVVVAAPARGAGLATTLLTAALRLADTRPCVLDAQAHLAGYYAGLGFTATGPEYVEDGIPHVPMRLTATHAAQGSAQGSADTSSATERRRPV
jgi:ElaA protein